MKDIKLMNAEGKGLLFIFLMVFGTISCFAQSKDATKLIDSFSFSKTQTDSVRETAKHYPPVGPALFSPKHFALPVAMIAYGFVALKSDGLENLDKNTQEEIWDDHPHHHVKVDNYLLFAPAAIVYGLNLAGIHGEHNFADRSGIYLMSNIFLNTAVFSLKKITHQERPDGSDYLSFPSGHTAEAFASAEFLRMEYRNVSPWYGVAGYLIAATTGYLRMYNDKHYLSDVIAGAGIGILSTDLSYWLYPKIKRVFEHHSMKNSMILPYYNNQSAGLSMVLHLP